MQSWCRTWPPNGSSRVRAKQKLLRKQKGACKSSWSRRENRKTLTLTFPVEFGKACEDLSWNHCASTPHRSETNGIAERAVRRMKGQLRCCCSQVWVKIGGQIPWNAFPICETFKSSCLMGRPHMREVLGNHLKNRSFRLVHWLSITLFLRKTSQESINLEREVLPGLFPGYALYAG